ncbi:M20/M25/M40 family metallo-hydrolase [Paremcibacter congregatus]|uniref:M20/M25/M40 family metallo-hydrolase n=1 Tax=Paremcibacter congregatus TaxID=2043170 RepID=UPI0030EB22A2
MNSNKLTRILSIVAIYVATLGNYVQSAETVSPNLAKLAEVEAKLSLGQLREMLSLPNDAHYEDDIRKNIIWFQKAFEKRGFVVSLIATEGQPLMLAERRTEGASKTALIYLQADGQPVDVSKWHQPSPYDAVLKEKVDREWKAIDWSRAESELNPEWRIFARSASDAKGPIAMVLAALDSMKKNGLKAGLNMKFVLDFEEELGSPHLPKAVKDNRVDFAADFLMIFDGPRHLSNRPTLYFGARGIANITLKVFGPKRPQHSGGYGNYAPNPALLLSDLLASMKDDGGRVTIPGFQDGITISEQDRKILAAIPDDEKAILTSLGIKNPDKVGATYQEAMQYPSLSILGLQSGWVGDQTRTIIPATATAELDARLVPEKDPESLIALVRQHIEGKGYHIIAGKEPTDEERRNNARLISFDHVVSYGAFRTPLDGPEAKWLVKTLKQTFQADPVQIRMVGGSIPIAPFVSELKILAIGVPTVYLENNQHSPNENLRMGNYVEGIQTFLAILTVPADF